MLGKVLIFVALALVVSCDFQHGETLLVAAVFRHGVRSPDDPPPSQGEDVKTYNFTSKTFPPWTDSTSSHPAGKGGLTANGTKVLNHLGSWYRYFYDIGYDCNAIKNYSYIYVDVSGRCQDSADAFWNGYAPNCDSIPTTIQPPTSAGKNVYPGRTLFKHYTDQFDLPNCHGNTNDTIGGGDITRRQEWLVSNYDLEIQLMDEALGNDFDKGLCYNGIKGKTCNMFEIPIEEPDWGDSSYFRGPMGYANYWSNYFLTQYFDGQEVAFGKLNTHPGFGDTRRIARVHYAQDMWQNLALSAGFSFTSELLGHLFATLDQAAIGFSVDVETINHPFYKKFITYFGHHENVSFLVSLLQLQLQSEDNDYNWIPFSGSFQFRLFKEIDPQTNMPNNFIEVYFVVPTPDQHRNLDVMDDSNPPSLEQVQIPWCTDSSSYFCRYEDFKNGVLSRFKTSCMYDQSLVNFIKKRRAEALFD